MSRLRMIFLTTVLALALPATAGAYTMLLDIDIDDDPTTLNISTPLTSATVKLVLAPDFVNEPITYIEFGLGGSCYDCWDYGHNYGTGCDLYGVWGAWIMDPRFESSGHDAALCIDCLGNPGWHHFFYATAVGGGFMLAGPTFIHTFEAWVNENIPEPCMVPPADLMTFNDIWETNEVGNTILLDFTTAAREGSWSAVKSLY